MKNKLTYVTVLLIAVFLTNCKKDSGLKPTIPADESNTTSRVLSASAVPANSVFTVAGKPYTSGATLANGPAATARFYHPIGIQLMADGTIFVADSGNNVIRQIAPTGDVSSLNVPDRSYVNPLSYLQGPKYVFVDKDMAVLVVDRDPYGSHDRLIGFTKNSRDMGGFASDYYDVKDLVKDPYENTVWTSFGNTIKKLFPLPSNYFIAEKDLTFANKYTYLPDDPGYYTFPALFAGYNGVIYFAYKGKLYKHTKNNVGSVIFPTLSFKNITCIMGNKDSRTIYIADDGYIKRIDDGRLTTIAGPNKTNPDSRDGVGFKADVYAKYLALSKDESTIYFSDTRANAIRKIVMR